MTLRIDVTEMSKKLEIKYLRCLQVYLKCTCSCNDLNIRSMWRSQEGYTTKNIGHRSQSNGTRCIKTR